MWLTRRPWDSYEWLMTNLGDSNSEIIPDGYVEPSPFLLHLYPVTIRLLRSKVASDVIFIRDDKQIMQYLHHAVIRWLFSIAYPWLRQSFDIFVHQLGTGIACWIRLLLLDLCQLQSPNKNHCTTLKSAHNSPKNGVYRHTQTCKTQNIDFSLKQNLNLNRIKPL